MIAILRLDFGLFRLFLLGALWYVVKVRERLPQGCQNKDLLRGNFFSFFLNTSSAVFEETYTTAPEKPPSAFDCLSSVVKQPQKASPCGLVMVAVGFMIEQKQTRHAVKTSAHMPRPDGHTVCLHWLCYCFYHHSLHVQIRCANLSSFQPVPTLLLRFLRGQMLLSTSVSFSFSAFSLNSHFRKAEPWPQTTVICVVASESCFIEGQRPVTRSWRAAPWVAERSEVGASSNPASTSWLRASKYRRGEDGQLGWDVYFVVN